MGDPTEVVVGVVALNDGQIVSKTRLQKTLFFLERRGLDTEFEFDYYHFGTFSAELARAADDAADAGQLKTEEKLGFHKEPYVVYETTREPPDHLGCLAATDVREMLGVLKRYSALELEVAASILFLRDEFDGDEAVRETKKRKPLKATNDRVDRALQLLRDLRLEADKSA